MPAWHWQSTASFSALECHSNLHSFAQLIQSPVPETDSRSVMGPSGGGGQGPGNGSGVGANLAYTKFLFVMARVANARAGAAETEW